MTTQFPTNLDDLTNPSAEDKVSEVSHAGQHADANDAIEAIQAKVGVNNSTVETSHDYKLGEITGSDKAVSKDGEQTLTNKTITSPVINEIKPSVGEALSLTDTTDTLVTRNTEETLANKTITSPKVNELTDSNGNETIETPTTASAVNNIEVKNSATGNDVEVNAKGEDTDIGVKIKGKGAGKVKLGSAELQVPNVAGGDGQVLTSDGAGVLSFTDKADFEDVPQLSASKALLAQAQDTPDLTLQVEAGNVYFGTTLVEYAGGNSPSFTAPTTNPRIDILSINESGTLVRTVGTEDASPTAPAVPAGEIPIAQVFNRVGQTTILDADDSSNGYIEKDLRPFVSHNPIDIEIFDQTGANTWTKPAGAKKVLVELWGAGGGGSGGDRIASNNVARGGVAGGGGGKNKYLLDASDIGSSVTVTVGSGGSAGLGSDTQGDQTNGGGGGTTTFGTILSAYGGRGGSGTSGAGGGGIFSGGGTGVGGGAPLFDFHDGQDASGFGGASGSGGNAEFGGSASGGSSNSENSFASGNTMYGGSAGGTGGSAFQNSAIGGRAGGHVLIGIDGSQSDGGSGGGGVTDGNASNGSNGTNGSGGGGGGVQVGTDGGNAGNGGNGSQPGGGGGGGGANRRGTGSSGNGGIGGDGLARITTFF